MGNAVQKGWYHHLILPNTEGVAPAYGSCRCCGSRPHQYRTEKTSLCEARLSTTKAVLQKLFCSDVNATIALSDEMMLSGGNDLVSAIKKIDVRRTDLDQNS